MKAIKIYLSITMTLIIQGILFSQNAAIIVSSGLGKQSDEKTTKCELRKGDSLVGIQKGEKIYYFTFEKLKAGKYTLRYFENDTLISTYPDFTVDSNLAYKFSPGVIKYTEPQEKPIKRDSLDKTGSINLQLSGNNARSYKNIYAMLYMNDRLIEVKGDIYYNTEFSELTPGVYRIQLMDKEKIVCVYNNVKVSTGDQVDIAITENNSNEKSEDDIHHEPNDSIETTPTVSGHLMYGNPELMGDTKNAIVGNMNLGFTTTWYFEKPKYLNFGVTTGAAFDICSFYKRPDSTGLNNLRRENYVGGKLPLGFSTKVNFYNRLKRKHPGITLEASILCNLPIFFHYVQGGNHILTKKYFIHQFTDVSATAKITYSFVGIMAEYRLMDYLISNYTELPKLKVGICFTIKELD